MKKCPERGCVFPVNGSGTLCEFHEKMFGPTKQTSIRGAHVILAQAIYLRNEKEPFVKSGVSILGALEYDRSSDKVRCHECGKYYGVLGGHLKAKHKMTARDYKLKHGLRLTNPLRSPWRVSKISRNTRSSNARRGFTADALIRARNKSRNKGLHRPHGDMEKRNVRSTCPAQLIAKVRELAVRLNHTPTIAEMAKAGIGLKCSKPAIKASDLMRAAGLLPRRYHPLYSQAVIIEVIRDFFVLNGRKPTARELSAVGPAANTVLKYFGSYAAAFDAAGIGRNEEAS